MVRYYAVVSDKVARIFTTEVDFKDALDKHPKARYRRTKTKNEAQRFINTYLSKVKSNLTIDASPSSEYLTRINTEHVITICCKSTAFGPSGCGAVIYSNAQESGHRFLSIGSATKEEAGYISLIVALSAVIENDFQSVTILGDDKTVVDQVNGHIRINNENVKLLYKHILYLINKLPVAPVIDYISRANNYRAFEVAANAISLPGYTIKAPFDYIQLTLFK